jgi:hypothetical protein
MREILTNTFALAKHFFGRRTHVGRFRIEKKLAVHAIREIEEGFGEGTARRKRWRGISGELRAGPDARRFERELKSIETLRSKVVLQRSGDLVPGHGMLRPNFLAVNCYDAARFDN